MLSHDLITKYTTQILKARIDLQREALREYHMTNVRLRPSDEFMTLYRSELARALIAEMA